MTTDIDLPVSSGTIRWAAERVLDMHVTLPTADRATGRCEQCRPDGRCDLLDWARLTLAGERSAASPSSSRRTA